MMRQKEEKEVPTQTSGRYHRNVTTEGIDVSKERTCIEAYGTYAREVAKPTQKTGKKIGKCQKKEKGVMTKLGA